MDIEDCMNKRSPLAPKNVAKAKNVPVITTKRNRENSQDSDEDLTKSWRQVLGNPPSRKTNVKEWVLFQKKKWAWQRKQKVGSQKNKRQKRDQVILFLLDTLGRYGILIFSCQLFVLFEKICSIKSCHFSKSRNPDGKGKPDIFLKNT